MNFLRRARGVGRVGKWDQRASGLSEKRLKVRQRAKLGKKLRIGRLIFRKKEDTEGLIERLALWSDVVNWGD